MIPLITDILKENYNQYKYAYLFLELGILEKTTLYSEILNKVHEY